MAYFPNGTSGMMFVEDNCVDCAHWKDDGDGRGHGCPVYDVHLLFNSDHVNEKEHPVRVILDTLIRPKGPECAMFHGHGRDTKTLPLFPE